MIVVESPVVVLCSLAGNGLDGTFLATAFLAAVGFTIFVERSTAFLTGATFLEGATFLAALAANFVGTFLTGTVLAAFLATSFFATGRGAEGFFLGALFLVISFVEITFLAATFVVGACFAIVAILIVASLLSLRPVPEAATRRVPCKPEG